MKLKTIFVLWTLSVMGICCHGYAAPDSTDPCRRADETGNLKDIEECVEGDRNDKDREQQKAQETEASRRSSAQHAIEEQRKADENLGYRRVSVSDLELDKETIKQVAVTGFVIQDGRISWLVEYPSNPNTPKVGLVIEHSPREVRAAFQQCRLSGICHLTLIGFMVPCEQTMMGTVVDRDRCLSPVALR